MGVPPSSFVSFEFQYLFLERTKAKRGCGVNIPFSLRITLRAGLLKCYRCFFGKNTITTIKKYATNYFELYSTRKGGTLEGVSGDASDGT